MQIKPTATVPSIPMAMPGAANVAMQILCGPDYGCPNFAMRKFTIAPGGKTPHHFHDFEHEIYVLAGTGTLVTADGNRTITAGDAIYVANNDPHQFANTSTAPLEFLCMVPAMVHKPGCPAPTPVDCGT
jgi:quercetin dioxygenase-like cupin family protein